MTIFRYLVRMAENDPQTAKRTLRAFWENQSGAAYWPEGAGAGAAELAAEAAARYRFEPYIAPFARFEEAEGLDVLEIGVGMGADHLRWARARPHRLAGIDLSERAVRTTKARLAFDCLHSALTVADAEQLPFPDGTFDLVYSWGVLHHTPDAGRAVADIHRVLRPGGVARVMIYHLHSVAGLLLWLRYGGTHSLREAFERHMESPGTRGYTVDEAQALFAGFATTRIRVQLSYGDLLRAGVGRRHRGPLLTVAKAVWPRWLLRRVAHRFGLYLLIEAFK